MQISLQPGRLSAEQFAGIGIFLLRHQGRSGRESIGISTNLNSALLQRMRSRQSENSARRKRARGREFDRQVAIGDRIHRILRHLRPALGIDETQKARGVFPVDRSVVPAIAPEPSGHQLACAQTSAKRFRSRSSISSQASKWWASETGCAAAMGITRNQDCVWSRATAKSASSAARSFSCSARQASLRKSLRPSPLGHCDSGPCAFGGRGTRRVSACSIFICTSSNFRSR